MPASTMAVARRCEPVLLGQQTGHCLAKQGQKLVPRRQLLGEDSQPVKGLDTFRVFAGLLERVVATNIGLLDSRDHSAPPRGAHSYLKALTKGTFTVYCSR